MVTGIDKNNYYGARIGAERSRNILLEQTHQRNYVLILKYAQYRYRYCIRRQWTDLKLHQIK
jgi:hypothetical protein